MLMRAESLRILNKTFVPCRLVVEEAMIGGFALAAAPAQYRVTGVQTFIVGSNGVVYQKDLGADTLKAFQSMNRYNPDKTWKITEDDLEGDSQD